MAIRYISTLDKTYADSNQTEQGTYYLLNNEIEVQRTNNFEFVCIYNGKQEGMAESYSEVIRLSVNRASVPHYNQDVIPVKRGNTTIKFAGVPSFGDGQISCIDYIGLDTLKALREWQSKSYNVATEKVGLVQDYKRTCQLYEYTPDGQTVRMFELYGCWISSLTEDEFNSESNGQHTIQCTITYDKANEVDPNKRSTV